MGLGSRRCMLVVAALAVAAIYLLQVLLVSPEARWRRSPPHLRFPEREREVEDARSSLWAPVPPGEGAAGGNEALLRRYLGGVFNLTYTCRAAIRLGSEQDGGYIFCEDAEMAGPSAGGCQMFSYGIRGDDNLEQAVRKRYGCSVEEFDPTVSSSPGGQLEGIRFHEEGLAGSGPMTVEGLGRVDTLGNHLGKYAASGRRLILKVDIEGNEWDSLSSVPDDVFGRVDHFVMEAHLFGDPTRIAAELASKVRVLDTLHRNFYLYHTHLVNCHVTMYPLVVPGVGKLPRAVELHFVRKGLVVPGKGPHEQHTELDAPCWGHSLELLPADYFRQSFPLDTVVVLTSPASMACIAMVSGLMAWALWAKVTGRLGPRGTPL